MHLMLGDTLRLEFILSEEAVILDPVLVTASARPVSDRYPMPGLESLFRRMALWGRTGYFVNRSQLEEYARFGYTVSRVISEMALNKPRGCRGETAVYWDGAFLGVWESMPRHQGIRPDDVFPPAALEAIELYIAPQIPAELVGGVRFPCRVIAFWSIRQPKR
jgi:hypothetical protein